MRHLLDGGYRVYWRDELTARAKGPPATEPSNEARSFAVYARARAKRATQHGSRGVTESLTG